MNRLNVANIARRLRNHDRFCKVYTHEKYCSCGRDKALEELFALVERQPEPDLADLRKRLKLPEKPPCN